MSDTGIMLLFIFEPFINGKTAKLLGLKIPQSLLIMADKVIE